MAQGSAADAYPLPIHGTLDWQAQPTSAGKPPCWIAELQITDLQAGELLLPSLALPWCERYIVRCSLTTDTGCWTLAPIDTAQPDDAAHPDPTSADPSSEQSSDQSSKQSSKRSSDQTCDQNSTESPAVTTHIDVYAIHQPIASARLRVELVTPTRATHPANYLFVMSRRQQSQPAAAPELSREVLPVPALSQMMQPPGQRLRTCSPTALSMVMSYYGSAYHPAFVDRCRHAASGMYGVWPLNIAQTAQRGFVAATELISSWRDVADCPGPLVASIRFDSNELRGAPLEKTAGHLVVVRGADATGVVCNDPAAPTAASVERTFDANQFSTAWLGYRGATYIVAPVPVADRAQTGKHAA